MSRTRLPARPIDEFRRLFRGTAGYSGSAPSARSCAARRSAPALGFAVLEELDVRGKRSDVTPDDTKSVTRQLFAAASFTRFRCSAGLGRRLPKVPRKILPRLDRRSPLPINLAPEEKMADAAGNPLEFTAPGG